MARSLKATRFRVRSTSGAVLAIFDTGARISALEGPGVTAAGDVNIPGAVSQDATIECEFGGEMVALQGVYIASVGAGVTAPTITTHPQSQTIQQGQIATLTVVATGTAPLSYEWRRDGTIIPGITVPSYSATLAGSYTVVVSNTVGSVTSNAAAVTVSAVPDPAFTVSPSSGTAPLSVAITNTSPGSYQAGDVHSWVFGDGNTSTSASPGSHTYNAAGSRTISRTITRGATTYGPHTQQVSVTSGSTQQTVTVTIGAAGRTVTSALLDSARNDGNPGGAYGSTTNIPMHRWGADYWRLFVRSSNFDADIAAAVAAAQASVPGATSAVASNIRLGVERLVAGIAQAATVVALTSTWDEATAAEPTVGAALGALPFNAATGEYISAPLTGLLTSANRVHGVALQLDTSQPVGENTVTVSTKEWNAGAGAPFWQLEVLVTVSGGGGGGTAPTITTHPQSQTIASGQTANLTVVATGTTPLTYQWRLNGATIAGATAASYAATGAGSYTVVVSNSAGVATSNAAVLTVTPAGSDMLSAMPQHAIGTEVSQNSWDADYLQRVEIAGSFEGYAGGAIAIDSLGYPTSGAWSLTFSQRGTPPRGAANINPLGVWKIRATPRTPGNPGTWGVRFGAGASMSNFAYDAGTNTVTADLTLTSNEASVNIQATQAVTDLRIVRPGVSTSTTNYLMDEVRLGHLPQFTALRFFNPMGQNNGYGVRIPSWSAWPNPARMIGEKGWGYPIKLFSEVHAAPQSRAKFLWVDAPHLWQPTGAESDYLNWFTYLRDNLPSTAGLLISGTNELWNSIYPKLHYLVAQVKGQTTSDAGDTVVQMTRADRIRITPAGRGNAWRALTAGSHAGGATTITLAAGGEGNVVVGDSVRFSGSSTNYTITSGLADVAAGGTIGISPGLSATLAAGSMLEIETYTCFGRWWGLIEARMWKIAKQVFGADWGVRVYGVCSLQFGNQYWHNSLYLPFLAESAQVAEFGQINTYIHGIGGAPYPGLDFSTYSACVDAADIVAKLTNSTAPSDTPLTWIQARYDELIALKNTYGIGHILNYESGMEHLGYVPNGSGGFFVHPNWIDALRSPAFSTMCNSLMAIHRAKGARLTVWLNAMGSSYVPGTGPSSANSAWGSLDQQLASSVGEAWANTTGRKMTALRDHMLVTGQLPL